MKKFIIIFGVLALTTAASRSWADIWNCEVEVSNLDESNPCMLGNPAATEGSFEGLKHDKNGKGFEDYKAYYKPCEDLGTVIAKIEEDNEVCAVKGGWNIISFKTNGVAPANPKTTANGCAKDDSECFWKKHSGFNGGELNIEKTISIKVLDMVLDLHGLNWFLDNDSDDICWGDPNDDGNCYKDAWGHTIEGDVWNLWIDSEVSEDLGIEGGWRRAIKNNIFDIDVALTMIDSFWHMGDDGDVAFLAGDRSVCPDDAPCGSYSKIKISPEISGPAFIVSSEFIIRDVLIKANGPIAKVKNGGKLILSNVVIDAEAYTGNEPLIHVYAGGKVYFKDIYNEQPDFTPETKVFLSSNNVGLFIEEASVKTEVEDENLRRYYDGEEILHDLYYDYGHVYVYETKPAMATVGKYIKCDGLQELYRKPSGYHICITKCDVGKGQINLATLDGATDKCVCKDDDKVLVDGVCTQSKLSQCKQSEKFNKETNECVLECPSNKFENNVARTCDVKKTCDAALQKYISATNTCECLYEGADAESCMCPSGTKIGVDIAGGFIKKCMPVETKKTNEGKTIDEQKCGAHQYFDGECMCDDGYIAIVGSKPLECEGAPAASCSGYLDASSGICIPKLGTTTPVAPSTPSTATAVNGALLTGPRGGCMSVTGATLPQGLVNILPYLLILAATRLRKRS